MDLLEQEKIRSSQFKRHPWEIVRLKILLFLLKKRPDKNLIVDVGSGDAFVATQLSEKLFNTKIAAVDINYNEQFINDNKRTNIVFLKNISHVPEIGIIDTILLMDVLEHIERPEDLLDDIRTLKNVSSATEFIITVPAFQFLFSEHDTFLKHYRRYNRIELNGLVCKEGFKIKSSGYFFVTLFFARLCQKLFGIKPSQGLHNWNRGRLMTSIIIALLWTDFKICWYLSRIGINLPGLSCYCICHPLPS